VSDICGECGAPVPAGGGCCDSFHALLALESQMLGGPGMAAHFRAVAAYGLQHPDSMNYTEDTLSNLREALADELDGRATVEKIRGRMRYAAEGPARVTRRPGEATVRWCHGAWPITVADVLTVEPSADRYCDRVAAWARSVCDALDVDSGRPRC
jgi:hypothetical protein